MTLGPLAMIALVLVGVLIGWVPSPLADIPQTKKLLEAHTQANEAQMRLLRGICVNTARTDEARVRCLE